MKTIKFNLIVNNGIIRNITELKENFNIDDIYELYQRGVLQKWLDVRNYKMLLEKVNSIDSSDDKEIVFELLNIFEFDTSRVNSETWAFSYRKTYSDYVSHVTKMNNSLTTVITEYHRQYEQLKDKLKHPIFKKGENMNVSK